ncbi:MAG: hypothetical protein ABJB40_09635 [Acidobacteriota bacterium]
MKTRPFALAVIAALLFSVTGFAKPDTRTAAAKKREAMRIVSILPASEGVAVFDSKRFLSEGLPTLLTANQPVLAEITAKLNEMQNRTGIDLRKFDQLAVGVEMKQISAKEVDFEPVVIANGDINAGALLAVAKLASNGTYREEKVGTHSVYVFSPKDVMQKAAVKTTNSKVADVIDKALHGITKEVAVTALDTNTLVIGSLARVTATVQGTSHVGVDITGLLSVKENAVMCFAFKAPAGGMSHILPLDNDELGTNVDAIRYVSGSLDIGATGTSVQMIARTSKPEQAKDLKDTLDGLQVVGGAIFGGSKRPDQMVYGRMIKNAKIEARGTDITLDLLIPQTDIDLLIGGVK